jgi:hypothetical protein
MAAAARVGIREGKASATLGFAPESPGSRALFVEKGVSNMPVQSTTIAWCDQTTLEAGDGGSILATLSVFKGKKE